MVVLPAPFADQGDDLAGCDRQVDAVEHRLAAEGDADLLQADQCIAHAALRQLLHRPTTSTVWVSTVKPTPLALLMMASLMLSCSSSMATWQARQIRNWPRAGVPVAAADEGVERGDAVHRAVFQQEVQWRGIPWVARRGGRPAH